MRRIGVLAIVLAALACKKKPKEQEPDSTPAGPPKVGHSVTKLPGSGGDDGSDHVASAKSDGGAADAPPPQIGGNGQDAYRDDSNHVHGPGGPVFMGHGPDCDASRDHCLRKGVWFSVGNIVAGRLYRALPVFELENKWWTWRGDEDSPVKLYKTQLAGNTSLSSGTPVIWFSDETDSKKWPDSEYEALTSSRWEAGVVDTPSSNGKVRIKGWNDAVPMDTVRTIVEVRNP
jgi:hypothetical protein